MRSRVVFILAVIGLVAGLVSAYLFGVEQKLQPPAFNPAFNPYDKGIYANGIIESYQPNGKNINIYPELPGTVTGILVSEGQSVRRGMPLIMIDDYVQRATVAQQKPRPKRRGQSWRSSGPSRGGKRWQSPWPRWSTPGRD
jgi:HlyD family secretion protein